MPDELIPNQKNYCFEVFFSLFLHNNNEPFLDRTVMCDGKWILYNQRWPVQWLDQEEAPKHFPKLNLHQKKGLWSLFGGLMLVSSTTAFWILAKPLCLRSTLSKLMRCSENGNACSRHWSTERAQFFSTTMLDCTSHNQGLKSWMNWATKFCLIHHIHLTSGQASRLLLEGKMLPQSAGHRRCFPRVCWIPKHGFFFFFSLHRNKLTYFSLAKMYWL